MPGCAGKSSFDGIIDGKFAFLRPSARKFSQKVADISTTAESIELRIVGPSLTGREILGGADNHLMQLPGAYQRRAGKASRQALAPRSGPPRRAVGVWGGKPQPSGPAPEI
ncbi:hypothetical protein R3P38DRAFT_2787498 [Favolaschia claudopus]|uniref:Uncharacterized protein n=1 Tax=Favolaschia claudopus TaxID=2862362 RepID=A0AAW0AN63_9AGAR